MHHAVGNDVGTDHDGPRRSFGTCAATFQELTSDKVHEQSWPKWDSPSLTPIIETMRACNTTPAATPIPLRRYAARQFAERDMLSLIRCCMLISCDGTRDQVSEMSSGFRNTFRASGV
jgi:hypothetical protein